MPTLQLPVLETSLQETYDWIDRIGLELDSDDRQLALAVLRGGLHALRDYLTVEQSAHLTAQFPTIVRGFYFESWTPDAPRPDRSLDAFFARIDAYLKGYEDWCSAEEAARAVFAVLEESLTGGGEKIRVTLPQAIRDLWD
jgi:uncharacterized protein (DUF2267 family)